VRLRKYLDVPADPPQWPQGYRLEAFSSANALALHTLLAEVFNGGADGAFEHWWARLQADPEYEPGLVFLVHDLKGHLVAAALCWNSSFVKDLAVRGDVRRLGLGRALMLHIFAVFRVRGERHVDLKTDRKVNADAMRLYTSLGMVEIDWKG